ncbi:Glyoxalase/bleomycin resistance protein/dioxygenase domain protein [mine drainage metagenome]|uniref:Glyoxalase/bleomycin resistance protein/dioxygenase domain protein n=1 Tax=mine drainage metagenome TaxID=410659 RepID=T0ZRN5_9ZZZZ
MPGIELGLEAVTVHVRDVERARTFYGGVLGLKELRYVPAGSLTYALPGVPTVLVLHIMAPQEQGRAPGTVTGLIFAVPDVEAACRAIRSAGGTIADEPAKVTNPSGTFVRATIADPDGSEFLLRQRLSE